MIAKQAQASTMIARPHSVRFTQIVTGARQFGTRALPILYGLDEHGRVWRYYEPGRIPDHAEAAQVGRNENGTWWPVSMRAFDEPMVPAV